jgi:hypothetical protein
MITNLSKETIWVNRLIHKPVYICCGLLKIWVIHSYYKKSNKYSLYWVFFSRTSHLYSLEVYSLVLWENDSFEFYFKWWTCAYHCFFMLEMILFKITCNKYSWVCLSGAGLTTSIFFEKAFLRYEWNIIFKLFLFVYYFKFFTTNFTLLITLFDFYVNNIKSSSFNQIENYFPN